MPINYTPGVSALLPPVPSPGPHKSRVASFTLLSSPSFHGVASVVVVVVVVCLFVVVVVVVVVVVMVVVVAVLLVTAVRVRIVLAPLWSV